MDNDQIYTKLAEVMRKVFDDSNLTVDARMVADDVDGWDSMGHIRLVLAVEQAFGVKFATAEIAGLENVGQLVDTIHRKATA